MKQCEYSTSRCNYVRIRDGMPSREVKKVFSLLGEHEREAVGLHKLSIPPATFCLFQCERFVFFYRNANFGECTYKDQRCVRRSKPIWYLDLINHEHRMRREMVLKQQYSPLLRSVPCRGRGQKPRPASGAREGHEDQCLCKTLSGHPVGRHGTNSSPMM